MVKGFNLELQDYCSYCGEFAPDVEKIDTTFLDGKVGRGRRIVTKIKCENACKCARMYEGLKERECNQ